jgi:hypothetical protein
MGFSSMLRFLASPEKVVLRVPPFADVVNEPPIDIRGRRLDRVG